MSLTYAPTGKWRAFAKLGGGYHANDARLVTGGTAPTFMPKAYGADLGAVFSPKPGLLFSGTAWGLASQQEFVYVGDAGIVEPSSRSLRYGVDLGARYKPAGDFAFGADLTLTRARSVDEPNGANRIPLVPPLTLESFAVYAPASGFQASARLRVLGDRPANEDYSITAAGYEVLDLVVGYRWAGVSVDLIVDNALDADWNETQFATESRLRDEAMAAEEIHFTPGTPRAVRGRVSWVF